MPALLEITPRNHRDTRAVLSPSTTTALDPSIYTLQLFSPALGLSGFEPSRANPRGVSTDRVTARASNSRSVMRALQPDPLPIRGSPPAPRKKPAILEYLLFGMNHLRYVPHDQKSTTVYTISVQPPARQTIRCTFPHE